MPATILISILLAALIGFILYRMIRRKKEGKSSCGCGCSSCALRDSCHPVQKEKEV